MNRFLAILAFIAFAGFIGILIRAVPSPDLVIISLFTTGLVAYDLITSSRRKG
ncbi:hypothetical protein [Pseudorhodobacter aquimaris]|uniref:hypothetical protein n=1 Tax=Pseudorhodobacter aquimaris TaxID=687412 RepID=UPI000B31846B|nr:hypothetical protein [Pseudorhodobacter aquimaris]